MKTSLAGKAVLHPPESENHRCLLRESVQVSCSREGSHQAENFSLLVSSILPLS
jgi:hypothetical protein